MGRIKEMSLSAKVLTGLGLGIVAGLFCGEWAGAPLVDHPQRSGLGGVGRGEY